MLSKANLMFIKCCEVLKGDQSSIIIFRNSDHLLIKLFGEHVFFFLYYSSHFFKI